MAKNNRTLEEEGILKKREEWKSEILNVNNQQAEIQIGIMCKCLHSDIEK